MSQSVPGNHGVWDEPLAAPELNGRKRFEELNVRQRVDRLGEGLSHLNGRLDDTNLRAAEADERLRKENIVLREEVRDLQAEIREREHAHERVIADLRGCLDAHMRRSEACLLHLQSQLDHVKRRQDGMDRSLAQVESEVLV
mmetsp:Transcript_47196/g.106940  ORF Transcript_47196/g.106940 Transcript_47196/m.106940 type:complete len:142 (-) Transcript_47196:117-542(-)